VEAASLSSPWEQREVRKGSLLRLQGKERACVLQAALLGAWRMLVVPHSDSQDCAQGRRAGRVSAGAQACLRAPTRCQLYGLQGRATECSKQSMDATLSRKR